MARDWNVISRRETEIMKTKNEYPKDSTKQITLAEETESHDNMNEDQENEVNISAYEDDDSSHYSVGGDNGW